MKDNCGQVEFGEIADFRNGLNFSKSSHGIGCLLIGIPDFKDYMVPNYESLGEINPEGIVKNEDYLTKGDILFVRSNGNKALVGRSLFIDQPITAVYSGFCIRARLISKVVLPLFCAYFTKSKRFRDAISIAAGGTSIQNLNQNILSRIKIPLPPAATQNRIVEILSTLDQKIALNNRINTELEGMAKLLYDYWFVQFDFPDENGQPYKSSGGEMVYNKRLKREIPVGWGDDSLWNVANYYNGLAMQKYRPEGDEKLRVIKIREMNNGFSDNTEFATPDLPAEAIVENGDVLFSWSATLDVKIWTQGKGALNQHIFKVTSDKYPKTFYYYELINYLGHFKMMAEKRKTTMGHITQQHLKQSRIVIPPIELINELDQILKPIFEKKVLLEQQNQHLTSLRDWLLPMLMNGQVRVGE
jgi:type I restriction enzyme S subunit